MSQNPLKKNLDFYIKEQAALVREHNGKTLLIHECAVVGVFDSPAAAYHDGAKRFEPGTVTVIRCEEGAGAYTVNARTVHRFSAMVAS